MTITSIGKKQLNTISQNYLKYHSFLLLELDLKKLYLNCTE